MTIYEAMAKNYNDNIQKIEVLQNMLADKDIEIEALRAELAKVRKETKIKKQTGSPVLIPKIRI